MPLDNISKGDKYLLCPNTKKFFFLLQIKICFKFVFLDNACFDLEKLILNTIQDFGNEIQ